MCRNSQSRRLISKNIKRSVRSEGKKNYESNLSHFTQLCLYSLSCFSSTAFGAWDKATASGGLIQTRALDFGGGPFANYTVLAVHRGDPANPNHAFVSISFPAFVGAITGIAQNGVGISEKVWMTYDKRSLQSGSYDGLADVFVLRDLLEKVSNRAEAIAYVNKAPR